jgi:hypothetical protein
MKRVKSISVIILLAVMAGCGGNKQSTDDVITVDVTASYPEKELILQDFMDVEYIVLETNDDFINQGFVEDIGKNIILVRNRNSDGDIFIYDRNGKALRKINRKGQGGEEYSQITDIILDEDNNEMFVKDNPARKIWVYDLYGNFKRSFKFADTSYYRFTFNYDRDHLICYKGYSPIDNEQSGHILISKQDGSITREIHIPVKEIKTPIVRIEKDDITIMPAFYLTTPCHGNWILMNTSSDTVYNYLPDGKINRIIVRTPSIHSMNLEIFLFVNALTDRYYFMHTMKKEVDFTTFKGFPGIDLIYDKQEKTLFNYTMFNDDFSNKRQVGWSEAINHEIASWQPLEAYQLVEAYEKGELKGKLKEIASTLDEDDNPVIMLIKHRK